MARTKKNTLQIPVPGFLSSGIETGRERLKDFEQQTEKMLKDLYTRGNDEIESLRDRLHLDELRERLPQLELDFEAPFQRIQERTFSAVGLATREEVAQLAKQVSRLSRKVDRLARTLKEGAPTPPKRRARKSGGKGASSSTKARR